MHIAGYIASLFIGISLGLIGGGGSILTVPVLVYLFGVNPTLATAYSLFVVGTSSLVGVIPKYFSKDIHWRAAFFFGIPSIMAVFSTRFWIVPHIPDSISLVGLISMHKANFIMVFFALLMLAAAYSMIRFNNADTAEASSPKMHFFILMLLGLVVGLVAGLVGAGGGFLIIPVLVFFAQLPMNKAIGTSLLIISAQSLIGFSGDFLHIQIDWLFLVSITAIAVVGLLLGVRIGRGVPPAELKKGFGWFVLAIAIYVLFKELL